MKFVVPILMFVLLIAPSVRLLLQSRGEAAGPERWAGLYFLFIAWGMPLRISGATLVADGASVGQAMNVVGHLGLFAASVSLTIFVWRVFHADSPTVRALAVALVGLQVATTAFSLATGAAHTEDSVAIIATNFMRVVPTIWACAESIGYWRRMRRRVGLGLADPVVANRFALWGVWTAAFAALPATALVLRIVLPILLADQVGQIDALEVQSAMLGPLRAVMGIAALCGLVALVLSFFPPTWYLARLRSGLATAEA